MIPGRKLEKMLKRSFTTSNGFTLPELLVALIVGSGVVGLAFTIAFFNRNLFLQDTSRTSVNQNLRSAIDITGNDIRQAGERLPQIFPAVMLNPFVANGDNPDTLLLYRSLLDTTLNVCVDVVAGTGNDVNITDPTLDIDTAVTGACLEGLVIDNAMDDWQNYRTDVGGGADGAVFAFIFDPETLLGEFFIYDGEDTAADTISRQSGTWQFDYPASNGPFLIILEKREYLLSSLSTDPANCREAGNVLTLIVNDDCDNQRFGVVNNIDDFQARVCLEGTATCVDDFSLAESADFATGWSDISSVEIEFEGSSEFGSGREVRRTISSSFFPRNVLSFPD